MPPSSRSRPFAFTFFPNGMDEAEGNSTGSTASPWPKQQVLPVNSFAPIEMENDHFKGALLLIHDTGNEVGLESDEVDDDPDVPRRGVMLQMQGKFKRKSSVGAANATGLYVGGELPAPLKIGFFTRGAINMCSQYVKKKTEGRFYFVLGDSKTNDKPQLAFPIAQLFTIIATPPDQDPPRLGSSQLNEVKWQGANVTINIDTESTYTFIYKTPYLDCCSWELLNVPGVSPLGLEKLLGDIQSSRVIIYDLGFAGSHKDWRKGAVIEWHFARRAPGEDWLEAQDEGRPLEEASDASGSERSESIAAEEGAVEEDEAEASSSSDSEFAEPVDDDEDEISRAESQALDAVAAWRPRPSTLAQSDLAIQVPYYIETIDRRWRQKLRVWYVFELKEPQPESPELGEWWTAKAITDLASLCRPRPRLRAFRRRRGANRGCVCYGAQTLEQFRQVVRSHLLADTRLKRTVIAAAKTDLRAPAASGADDGPMRSQVSPVLEMEGSLSPGERTAMSEAEELESKTSSHPPSAVVDLTSRQMSGSSSYPSGSATLPQGSLKEAGNRTPGKYGPKPSGMKKRADEGLELMKKKSEAVKKDLQGMRLKTEAAIKNKVKRRKMAPPLPPRFFVGSGNAYALAFAQAKEGKNSRVHESLVGAVHFEGRLCEELLRLSKDGCLRCFMPYDCDKPRIRLSMQQVESVQVRPGPLLGRFVVWEVHTLLSVLTFCSASQEDAAAWVEALTPFVASGSTRPSPNLPVTGESAKMLMDLTRARRWRPSRRIVLNDRVLLLDESEHEIPEPSIIQGLLNTALGFGERPDPAELLTFINDTCRLKAVQFTQWSRAETLAFWLNVYHCLLLHGKIVFGNPRSRGAMQNFYSRVSYLVGTKPVSLKEIERYILRVPISDRVAMGTSGRARGRQVLAFCCLCKRRRGFKGPGSVSFMDSRSPTRSNSTSPKRGDSDKGLRRASSGSSSDLDGDDDSPNDGTKGKRAAFMKKCLPTPTAGLEMMTQQMLLIQKGFQRGRNSDACLYLGAVPTPFAIPPQDLRAVFCINRGNYSCGSTIPMFSAANLEEQMVEVCRSFLSDIVKWEEKDNVLTRVSLPHCCRGLKRELINDMQALLRLVWPLISQEKTLAKPTRKTQVRFMKHRSEPRLRHELTRFTYSRPEIEARVEEVRTNPSKASQDSPFKVSSPEPCQDGTGSARPDLVVVTDGAGGTDQEELLSIQIMDSQSHRPSKVKQSQSTGLDPMTDDDANHPAADQLPAGGVWAWWCAAWGPSETSPRV